MRSLRMFLKCLFVWKIRRASDEELRNADVVFGLAWSPDADGNPGPGNIIFAKAIRGICEEYNLPVILQHEVYDADPDLPHVGVAMRTKPGDGRSSFEWNTQTIVQFAAEICKKHEWKNVVMMTSGFHTGRAIWVCEKLGLNTIAVPISVRGCAYPQAVHWNARIPGQLHWIPREFLTRLYFLWKEII